MLKWPGNEVDNSPPSSAEGKNEWSYTLSSPICLLEACRKDFTFFSFMEEDQAVYRLSDYQRLRRDCVSCGMDVNVARNSSSSGTKRVPGERALHNEMYIEGKGIC